MSRAVAELAGMGHPDAEPKLIGRNIHVMLTPLPVNKRKPRFHEPDENRAEHEPGGDGDQGNGTGPGAGHLDGPTGTDDTWYRLVLVNTGGRWKVLGTDQFSYGCGC